MENLKQVESWLMADEEQVQNLEFSGFPDWDLDTDFTAGGDMDESRSYFFESCEPLNSLPPQDLFFQDELQSTELSVVLNDEKKRPVPSKMPIEDEEKLTFSDLSRCFGMPISKASKMLMVGETQLKARCRKLAIPRWPHRKIKTLQTLIDNLNELIRDGGEAEQAQLMHQIERVKWEKRMMEITPTMELSKSTERLRQACFKAKHKKKMCMY